MRIKVECTHIERGVSCFVTPHRSPTMLYINASSLSLSLGSCCCARARLMAARKTLILLSEFPPAALITGGEKEGS